MYMCEWHPMSSVPTSCDTSPLNCILVSDARNWHQVTIMLHLLGTQTTLGTLVCDCTQRCSMSSLADNHLLQVYPRPPWTKMGSQSSRIPQKTMIPGARILHRRASVSEPTVRVRQHGERKSLLMAFAALRAKTKPLAPPPLESPPLTDIPGARILHRRASVSEPTVTVRQHRERKSLLMAFAALRAKTKPLAPPPLESPPLTDEGFLEFR